MVGTGRSRTERSAPIASSSTEPIAAPTPIRPHRLRDLDGRARIVTVIVVALVAAPYVASVIRSIVAGWIPNGDNALITLRAEEILQGRFPLVGQPSTAGRYMASVPPDHPGPIEFYLAAPFIAVFGLGPGMLVAVGLMNLTAVLTTVWVMFRRAGSQVALGAAAIVGLIAYAQGPGQLTDPLSSNLGGITVIALIASAWGIVDGDIRLVPAAAFAFAFVAQQHLAIVGLAVGIALLAVIGVVLVLIIRWRAPAEDRSRRLDHPGVWIGLGLVVSAIAWSPVILDQFVGDGNISRMIDFARHGGRESIGWGRGFVQTGRALALPPPLFRTGWEGSHVVTDLRIHEIVTAVLVVAALVTIAIRRRRSSPTHSRLAITTLVVAVIGTWMGSQVPASVEALRINFYRWIFVVSTFSLITLGWAAVVVVRHLIPPERAAELRRAVVPVGVAVTMLTAGVAVFAARPIVRPDQYTVRAARDISDAALQAAEGSDQVLLLINGSAGWLHIGPVVAMRLVAAGHDVKVEPRFGRWFGTHRIIGPDDRFDLVLHVASGPEPDDLVSLGERLVRSDFGLGLVDDEAALGDELVHVWGDGWVDLAVVDPDDAADRIDTAIRTATAMRTASD